MPRRYAPKRRLVRRKRMMRRRFKPVRRQPRGQPNIYSFKRTVFLKDDIIINAGTDYFATWDFPFSFLPAATDFTNLYDEYMIKKVVVKIIPKITNAALGAGSSSTNSNLQQIHSAIDYDDATVPSNISQLTQYQSHRMTRGNQIHTRVLVPKTELTAGGSTAAPKSYQWLDCDNTTISQRGLKLAIPAPPVANTQVSFDVMYVYYFSCKNVL